jgi:hypothetical protein
MAKTIKELEKEVEKYKSLWESSSDYKRLQRAKNCLWCNGKGYTMVAVFGPQGTARQPCMCQQVDTDPRQPMF